MKEKITPLSGGAKNDVCLVQRKDGSCFVRKIILDSYWSEKELMFYEEALTEDFRPKLYSYKKTTDKKVQLEIEYIEKANITKNTTSALSFLSSMQTRLFLYKSHIENDYDDALANFVQRYIWAITQEGVSKNKALKAMETLLALNDTEEDKHILVHGDFQAKNLLSTPNRGLFVIDPMPYIGHPMFDKAMYLVGQRLSDQDIAKIVTKDTEKMLEWIRPLRVLEGL